jgi:hypothetical protein
MGRKRRVDLANSDSALIDRSPEEKWEIVQEGLNNGNVPGTCRRST